MWQSALMLPVQSLSMHRAVMSQLSSNQFKLPVQLSSLKIEDLYYSYTPSKTNLQNCAPKSCQWLCPIKLVLFICSIDNLLLIDNPLEHFICLFLKFSNSLMYLELNLTCRLVHIYIHSSVFRFIVIPSKSLTFVTSPQLMWGERR